MRCVSEPVMLYFSYGCVPASLPYMVYNVDVQYVPTLRLDIYSLVCCGAWIVCCVSQPVGDPDGGLVALISTIRHLRRTEELY